MKVVYPVAHTELSSNNNLLKQFIGELSDTKPKWKWQIVYICSCCLITLQWNENEVISNLVQVRKHQSYGRGRASRLLGALSKPQRQRQ